MPNKEPDAPVEAMAGAAKFPPRTKPNMPLLMYTTANLRVPIAFSMSRPSVSCNNMLKAMCTIPA